MNQLKDFFQWLFEAIKIWVIIQPWQSAIIMRMGKKRRVITSGMHFKIPYIDSVFVQESRLRVCEIPIQTLTTSDEKTITLNGAIGYSIKDIEKLYSTLYHPETTVKNIVMAEMAKVVFSKQLKDISPDSVSEIVLSTLQQSEYGLSFEYFRITNFAIVRTFRLIQDQSWISEGLDMGKTK